MGYDNLGNKKKVCLVIPSLQAGGMERVMSELANYFSNIREIEVHLVLYGKSREIFYKLSENVIIHKPNFEFPDENRIISAIKTWFFLRKEIKKINPYSVLSFGEYWNSFLMLALLGLKFQIYLSDRSQPDKKLTYTHEYLRKWLYPKARGIIAQTSNAKRIYYTLYKHPNIQVIGNPVRKIWRDINDSNNNIKKKILF